MPLVMSPLPTGNGDVDGAWLEGEAGRGHIGSGEAASSPAEFQQQGHHHRQQDGAEHPTWGRRADTVT